MTAGDLDRVIIYTDAKGKSRWRMRAAGNGVEIGAASQGYRHDRDLFANVERVTQRLTVDDVTKAATWPKVYILTIDERDGGGR